MRFTIFTSTYNRGYIIENLYNSLKEQTFKDFEWIVVDDGSSDNTEFLVNKWVKENPFVIKYLKKQNGGKHRAINDGLNLAEGDLFFIVDSDDILPPNSLYKVDWVERRILKKDKSIFAGVCGKKISFSGKDIGTSFVGSDYLDITQLECHKYNICGDKAEVYYTNILRKYKFPEFEGENFLTECVVWDKIAHDGYKLRYFNDVIYLCEYLSDGLTKNYYDIYKMNPKGYGLYIHQSIVFKKMTKKDAVYALLSYYLDHKNKYSIKELSSFLYMNVIILRLLVFCYNIKHLFKKKI